MTAPQNERKLYVLTMRSGTSMSRIIHKVTRANLTHSSIGFDPRGEEFYSFARRKKNRILPAGFVHENIRTGVMGDCTDAPCMLFELTVSAAVWQAVRDRVDELDATVPSPTYDIPGILYSYFHVERENCKSYVCSRFVAETLGKAGAIKLKKAASLYRPLDFLQQEELTCIYQGTMEGLRQAVDEGRL